MNNYPYEGSLGILGNGNFILFFLVLLVAIFFYLLIKKNKDDVTDSTYELKNSEPLHKTSEPVHKINEAFEILKIRYAKGEINEEEFERIKNAIM